MVTVEERNDFAYTPLKNPRQIRLIQVHPSKQQSWDEPVEISFSITDLAQPDYYNTLSYTWGKTFPDGSHLTETVLCDGKQLKVTSNLNAFLRRMRVEVDRGTNNVYARMPIWIDALSISQNDDFERSQQVSIMAKIYETSFQLIIWLGEVDLPECPDQPLAHSWPASVSDSVAKSDSAEKSLIESIVQSPWFQRRWIIQEVIYTQTRTIWIGEKKIPWANLIAAVERAQLSGPAAPVALMNAASFQKRDEFRSPLLENLRTWDHADCGDPRDRVFALVSISTKASGFDIDYSNDAETAYYQVAKNIIESKDRDDWINLLISAISRSRKGNISTLPSWVPDWRIPAHDTSTSEQQRVIACFFRRNFTAALRAIVRHQYLHLTGWLFLGCHCRSTKSGKNVRCDCCCPKQANGRNVGCQCHRCAISWMNKFPTFHSDWGQPAIPEGQILCFLEGSRTAFILIRHPDEEPASDKRLYQLVTCLPLAQPFRFGLKKGVPSSIYNDVGSRFGEPEEIIIA